MSGPGPMLNQLHKMAMMRKRTLIGDNELYEMMRSRQVYHVQTDLQKRLSETLSSLEHDRELALAGILSRKLIFLRQVGKRERKRKKLVNVKKEMDEILRDADLEHLSSSLNQVWESNQPETHNPNQSDHKVKSDLHPGSTQETGKETSDSQQEGPSSLIDGSSTNLRRIEKGVDLYLASTNPAGRARRKENDDPRRGRARANKLPSIVLSSPRDEKEEVKSVTINNLSPLPPTTHSKNAPSKVDRDVEVTEKTRASNTDSDANDADNNIDTPQKTFKTEPTDILIQMSGTSQNKELSKSEMSQITAVPHKEKPRERKSSKDMEVSRSGRGKNLETARTVDIECNAKKQSDGAINLPQCKTPEFENRQSKDALKQRGNGQTHQSPYQRSVLLKPAPPYLVSTKLKQNARAATSLSSGKLNCLRACMEKTVTMIYVEDSEVETPKSSFDIDAWLSFIRQKKGYSATLKDCPLEGPLGGTGSNDQEGASKRNVRFALRNKKLKALRPPCKTCRDRAMEWFREFSTMEKKGKKRSSKKQNPLKTENLPELQDSAVRNPTTTAFTRKMTELPRLKRETTNQLLQRIREDSKLLQERVQHLCNDDYWNLWSKESADDGA